MNFITVIWGKLSSGFPDGQRVYDACDRLLAFKQAQELIENEPAESRGYVKVFEEDGAGVMPIRVLRHWSAGRMVYLEIAGMSWGEDWHRAQYLNKLPLDKRIIALRSLFRIGQSDDESMYLLQRIDALQRLRFGRKGKFLPHKDGRVYYFDLDMGRWFRTAVAAALCLLIAMPALADQVAVVHLKKQGRFAAWKERHPKITKGAGKVKRGTYATAKFCQPFLTCAACIAQIKTGVHPN